MLTLIFCRIHRVSQNKIPNTKITISQKCVNILVLNCAHSLKNTTAQKCAALCCIYLTYTKLTEAQTSTVFSAFAIHANFATLHC